MPYGYFQLVRFVAMVVFGVMAYRVVLLPQRLVPPPARTPHGGRIDGGVFGEQSFDVGNKGVRRIDGVKPVGDIAQVGAMLTLQSNGFGYNRRYNWFVMGLTGNALDVMTRKERFIYYRLQQKVIHLQAGGEPLECEGDVSS